MESVNFTAFDIETAYGQKNACQIGIVIVRKGKIVEEKSYLIQPPENKISAYCTKIHGIKPSMTKDALTFDKLWEEIRPYFEKQVIVHHSDGFDVRVLNQELDYYNIESCRFLAIESTMMLFPYAFSRSLKNLCLAYNIQMEHHHDGLSDARNCAEIFLKYLNGENPDYSVLPKKKSVHSDRDDLDEEYKIMRSNGIIPDRYGDRLREIEIEVANGSYHVETIEESSESKKENRPFIPNPDNIITSETRIQNLEIVENKNTLFYDKKIVISGVFDRFPHKDDLGVLLKGYGVKINTSISKNTEIFIIGNAYGSVKMSKVKELQGQGCGITIIDELELYKILDSITETK